MERDYSQLPAHMQESAKNYIEAGLPPGSFLTAVICNDLKNAFGQADKVNRECLYDFVKFFYNHAPAPCWGSPEKMKAWMGSFDAKENAC